MKIDVVELNNRKRAFEVTAGDASYSFPYAKADPEPTAADPIVECCVDDELGGEALTYQLRSGRKGFVHIEMVLEYNREPSFMRDLLLYQLTVEAQRRLEGSRISKREVIRRLNTSPAQLYRLLDQTNYNKSVDKMLELLGVLGCEVTLSVRSRSA